MKINIVIVRMTGSVLFDNVVQEVEALRLLLVREWFGGSGEDEGRVEHAAGPPLWRMVEVVRAGGFAVRLHTIALRSGKRKYIRSNLTLKMNLNKFKIQLILKLIKFKFPL